MYRFRQFVSRSLETRGAPGIKSGAPFNLELGQGLNQGGMNGNDHSVAALDV